MRILIVILAAVGLSACATTGDEKYFTDSGVAISCAEDPSSVNSVSGGFRYDEIAGKEFIWVGDDDDTGIHPLMLKMGDDCVLRAKRGYEDFGESPEVVTRWQYTDNGAIRMPDWSDQFSMVETTSSAHEICWTSFSSCDGEGQLRSDGGVRRLFFNEADAKKYFDSL